MEKKYYVMVYGTLKKGFYNHKWMEDAGGKFIDTAITTDSVYDMVGVSNDAYPGVVSGDKKIGGEIYEVPYYGIIQVLDMLEGYPTMYDRGFISVELQSSKEKVDALIYYLTEKMLSGNYINRSKKVVVSNNVCNWRE